MKNEGTTFRLKCGYTVHCRSERTRYGFRHVAQLFDTSGYRIGTSKACYYNRTWESFTFESVIRQVLDGCKAFDKAAVEFIMERLNNESRGAIAQEFRSVAGMAAAMALLSDNQKDANAGRKRIMAAGLPGISFPADWDTLPEDEKARRMDKALKEGCKPL